MLTYPLVHLSQHFCFRDAGCWLDAFLLVVVLRRGVVWPRSSVSLTVSASLSANVLPRSHNGGPRVSPAVSLRGGEGSSRVKPREPQKHCSHPTTDGTAQSCTCKPSGPPGCQAPVLGSSAPQLSWVEGSRYYREPGCCCLFLWEQVGFSNPQTVWWGMVRAGLKLFQNILVLLFQSVDVMGYIN